eukprot:2707322-Amphidinium_carterae.3
MAAEMTHLSNLSKTDPEIRGTSARIPGRDLETHQTSHGSALEVLEEPVEDHPVGVVVEGVTTLSRPLVVHRLAGAVATG